jgi:hypothetical protein
MANLIDGRAIAFCHPERSEGSPIAPLITQGTEYNRYSGCEIPHSVRNDIACILPPKF